MSTSAQTTNEQQTDATTDQPVTNHISEIRLRLPENMPYIDARPGLSAHEIVEQVVFFDDIYPKSTETITAVSDFVKIEEGKDVFESYIITCANTGFIPSEHMKPGTDIEAEFLGGDLAGNTFRILVDKKYITGGSEEGETNKIFQIVPNYYEVGDKKIQTPNRESKPRTGDQFVLKNIHRLPDEQVAAAEQELLAHAKLWAREHSSDTDLYTCETNPIYCSEHDISLPLGQRVRLMDTGRFGATGRASRVQEYEKSLTSPYKATYTIGDNTPYSRLGSLENTIEKERYEVAPGIGGGRGTYLIQSKYDLTVPSDYNAYSAAATDARFLSKSDGGTVRGNVRFDADVAIGGDVVSSDFRQDAFAGAGYGIYNDDSGQRVLEIDKVKVRRSLEVNELVTNQVTHIGGRQIYSAAGMKIARVEAVEGGYRCYMDTRNGQELNRFAAGDQAYCQQYSPGSSQVTKYYWRLVTAAGDDYIDLSAEDCDGTGIPEAGDLLAQVGNRTDKNRQAMYEIDQTAGGAVVQYAGINSFNLNDKNCIGQFYDKQDAEAKFYAYGETYIGDRDPQAEDANYITFQKGLDNSHKRLHIKGQVHIGSGSTGLSNLAGWSEAQTKIDEASQAAISANEIASAMQGDIETLRNQIDGQVECWFKDYNPSLQNLPASAWTDALKKQTHEGDTFTNLVSGRSWRWTKSSTTYAWVEMDAASARALASASASQAALDGRCAVFLRTPLETDTYQVGDLWMNATYTGKYSNDLLRAVLAKDVGEPFNIDHWAPATKYTDDSAVIALRQEFDASIEQFNRAIDEINADTVFDRSEKQHIRTVWENINGQAGFEHPETTAKGSYARTLAAAAAAGEVEDPTPAPSAEAFRAADNEEFMVQKA